jgi:hypothetical protein
MMPLVIELALAGKMWTMMLIGTKILMNLIVAEGERMTITWVELLLVLLLLFEMPPPKAPPEAKEYVTGAARQKGQEQLNRIYNRAITMLSPPSVVTRLGSQGMSRNESRTTTRSPGAKRKGGRHTNRSLARSMRLLMVTCMSAESFQVTTAFDLDSKQIAIGNYSSRCMTVSRRDFLPGTLRKSNVLLSGIGGTIECEMKGTVKWTVGDNQGRAHNILIPDTPMCAAPPPTDCCCHSIGRKRQRKGVVYLSFEGSGPVAIRTRSLLP